MYTVVVSLPSSVERRAEIDSMMAAHGLDFEYFDAVDVRNGPHPLLALYDGAKSRRLKGYELTDAEIGCFASHYSLWRRCADLDEPILILEDNVEIRGDLDSRLALLEEKVVDFGVLKLAGVFERPHVTVDRLDDRYEIVRNNKGTRGTSAYLISPDRAKAWLALAPGFFEPVDNFMESEWRTRLPVYSIHPWLAARRKTASIIGDRKKRAASGITSKLLPEIYRGYARARQRLYSFSAAGRARHR